MQCETSKQAKTESRNLTKFKEEIESANQSLEETTKMIVAQRQELQELVGLNQELAASNAKATKMLVAQRKELAASNRTVHVQQQTLFMLQHMSNATAPTTQKSSCVLM
jgi:chromosome segregation ATPase